MAINTVLYPLDFSTLQGVVTDDSSSLETAISTLSTQARDTAVQQAQSRRLAGQMSAALQNQQVTAQPILMPLYLVGTAGLQPPFLGTACYLGGGRGDGATLGYFYQLTFANECFIPQGIRLTVERGYTGTLCDAQAGRFCGGAMSNNVFGSFASADKLSFATKSMVRMASMLSIGIWGLCGGMGNKTKGFLMGGWTETENTTRLSHRLTYATDTFASLGNYLLTKRAAPHNGLSSKFSGYILGGAQEIWFTNVMSTVERVTFSNESVAQIGSQLTYSHMVHASFGYDVKGYLAGGGSFNGTSNWNWFSDNISALTYSGEGISLLSSKLIESRVCADGSGSSAAGFIVGGDSPSSSWRGSKTTDKLIYSSETSSRIGSQMAAEQADQGAISDYGAGFSY